MKAKDCYLAESAKPMDRREWTARYFDHANMRMEEIDFFTAESELMTHEEQAHDAAYGIAGSNDYELKERN